MNFLSMIASLRKFGNFVVGLFPVLGTMVDYVLSAITSLLTRNERLKSGLEAASEKAHKVADLKLVRAATPAVRRFYWKDYAQDRLQLDELPAGALVVLRPLFIVTVALCMLMPLVQIWREPSLAVETFAGYKSTAPVWSIMLWYVAAALGWGCLVAGAALCNRIFFTFTAIIYVTLFGACALFLPQSFFNAIIPLVVFLAIGEAEKNRRALPWRQKKIDGLAAYSMALAAGIPAGVYLLALTPMQPAFKPFVLQAGCLLGAAIAVSAVSFQRRKSITRSSARLAEILRSPLPGALSAWLFSLLSYLFLCSLMWRGNLGELAGQFISEMSLWNGYLWPVWYFIGIGIVFKLIKNTKVLTRSIKEAVPASLYSAIVIALLLAGALITWRNNLVAWTVNMNFLAPVIVPFYQYTKWYYSEPINSFSAEVLRWFFLFDLVAISWLVAKRRWNADTAGSLLYFSALSWFAVTEYMFQWLSFGRSPAHSVFLLTTFSMWLLWLFHTVGLEMSLKSSRSFPAIGRLAVFGSIVVFALLEIHARCAIDDMRVMNEIFLYMFRGIIDVGLPYFLYVFATRRFAELPISISRIFAIFVCGAVLSYPLNVLDKLALGGWSADGLLRIWAEETASLSTTGSIGAQEPQLSVFSIALRSLVYIFFLAIVGWRALAASAHSEAGKRNGAVIFSCLAFASGFASFSKTTVDLPLPDNLRVLVAPFHTSLFFDYYLIALYLSAGIAALALALILIRFGTKGMTAGRWLMASSIALAANFCIMWAWPGQAIWLRSTGILETSTIIGGVILVLLLVVSVRLIENQESSAAGPLITIKQAMAVSMFLLVLLSVRAYSQWQDGRLVRRDVSICDLQLPQKWQAVSDKAGSPVFICKEGSDVSTIAVSRLSAIPPLASLKPTLADLILKIQKGKQFIGFKPVKVESWSRYGGGAADALAFDFDYSKQTSASNTESVAMTGTIVLKPAIDDSVICYCLLATPVDMEARRCDLVRTIQASPSHSGNAQFKP